MAKDIKQFKKTIQAIKNGTYTATEIKLEGLSQAELDILMDTLKAAPMISSKIAVLRITSFKPEDAPKAPPAPFAERLVKSSVSMLASLYSSSDTVTLLSEHKESDDDINTPIYRFPSLRDLPALEALAINNTAIRNIPANCLRGRDRIKSLDLSNNPFLNHLEPTMLHACVELDIISLSGCALTHIPEELFSKAKKVKSIYLSLNAIKSDINPRLFDNCEQLKDLDLSGNEFRILPEKLFSKCSKLESLNLAFNDLEELHTNQFSGCPSLLRVTASFNNLITVPEELFAGCPELFYINFSFNKLESISSRLFSFTKELQFIFMHNNGKLMPSIDLALNQLCWVTGEFCREILLPDFDELCQSLGDSKSIIEHFKALLQKVTRYNTECQGLVKQWKSMPIDPVLGGAESASALIDGAKRINDARLKLIEDCKQIIEREIAKSTQLEAAQSTAITPVFSRTKVTSASAVNPCQLATEAIAARDTLKKTKPGQALFNGA